MIYVGKEEELKEKGKEIFAKLNDKKRRSDDSGLDRFTILLDNDWRWIKS